MAKGKLPPSVKCAYCGHAKHWHRGSRILDSDGTECVRPTSDRKDECACTSFMTTREYVKIYGVTR